MGLFSGWNCSFRNRNIIERIINFYCAKEEEVKQTEANTATVEKRE
jgi:hypothetical protein